MKRLKKWISRPLLTLILSLTYTCPIISAANLAQPTDAPNDSVPMEISKDGFQKQMVPNPTASITASGGTQLNRVSLSWSEFSPAASMFDNPGYELEIINTTSTDNRVARLIRYVANRPQTIVATAANTGLRSGVLHTFRIRACSNYNMSSATCGAFSSSDPGFALARYPATSPSPGVALINWNQFSPNIEKYRLERCAATGAPLCNFINVGNVFSYEDTSAVFGESYVYSVFACRSNENSSCVKTGDSNPVQIQKPSTPNPITAINASDGNQLNRIGISWSEFTPSAALFDNPGYQLEITNSISTNNRVTRFVPYTANQARTSIVTAGSSGIRSGVLNNFRVRACSNYNTSSADCGDYSSSSSGFALARYPATSPSVGVARINWNRFSPNTLRYRLQRCQGSAQVTHSLFSIPRRS